MRTLFVATVAVRLACTAATAATVLGEAANVFVVTVCSRAIILSLSCLSMIRIDVVSVSSND